MKLKKALNGLEVFSIAAGSMISSGLFVLPAIAYAIAGDGILISYFFAGLLMLPALFSILELSTAMPKAGGAYFFTERILGSASGVVNGFASWFSVCLKSAFALIGIGAFAGLVYPGVTPLEMKFVSIVFCVLFTVLNLYSIKSSGSFQIVLVIFLIVILFIFIAAGYRVMDFDNITLSRSLDWWSIFIVTGMVFISYGGLTKIASIAEEIKDPNRNLPRGGLFAYIIVQILYILTILVLIGMLDKDILSNTLTPVSDAAYAISPGTWVGNSFKIITAIGAILAFITTANAGIMTASRIPMSMSRDGLIPEFFHSVTKKKKIPFISVLFTSFFIIVSIAVLDLEGLAKVASLFMLLLFTMVNISLIIIRKLKLSHYNPGFKSPLFPFIQIAGVLVYIFLIIEMGMLTIALSCFFVIAAILWYYLYTKNRVSRKSALVHMVEAISNPELDMEESEIEKELLEILIEREEIEEDRFDKLIRNSIVLDFDRTIGKNQLFTELSEAISGRWGFDTGAIEAKLHERENQATTVIYDGVALPHAIPHITTEGESIFDIILVRNKYGIIWNTEGDIVYTAFCLIGGKGERNFHLRSLMFIAQILQDNDFQHKWMKAKNDSELRSIILLTKRKRQ